MPPALLSHRDLDTSLAAFEGGPFPDRGHGPYRLIRGALDKPRRRFERGLVDPAGAQAERLAAILGLLRGSAFARDQGLDGTEDLDAFRAKLPVRLHAALVPWLDRVAAGEPGVLTHERPSMLLETSGTTGRPKHLPVTPSWAASYGDAQALWILGLLRDDEQLRFGKVLSMVSPAEHARSPGGLPIGANTGRMFLAQPFWMRWRAPVPYAAYTIRDPELRAYVILRLALGAPVSSWTTANPSTILLYCRRLQAWWEDLRADVADGTLRRGPAAGLSRGQRLRLWWASRRRRLPEQPVPARIWGLRRVNCWKGGASSFFLDRLAGALGADVPVREAGVNASEGWFGVPVDDGDPVAHLGGHLLEFLPVEGDGPARMAWEVEPGAEYRLVVTTEAGLCRYDLGDVVRVTGWCGRAPRLVFVRKVGNVLNATGEKVTEDQVAAAARRALPGAVGVSVSLGWGEVPCQRIAVEGAAGEPDAVAARYDAALMEANVEYADKRRSGRLGPPRVRVLRPGRFAEWRAERVAAGAPEAQVKDPLVLAPERWDALVAAGAPVAAGAGDPARGSDGSGASGVAADAAPASPPTGPPGSDP
jgi:hypothetical protein